MQISIQNRQRKFPINDNRIQAWAGRILSIQKISEAELGLVFVNNRRMRFYNRTYRQIDRATDVLAFPMREGPGGALHPNVLGDVVISLEKVAEDAPRYGRQRDQHLLILLIHGILHLLGYDHTGSTAEAKRMARRERILLQHLYDES